MIIDRIFKILVIFLSYRVACGFTVNEVKHYAECMAQCQQKLCRDACIRSEFPHKKIEVSTESANFNASLHCKDVDLLAIRHNPGIYLTVMEDTSNTWRRISVIEGQVSIFHNLHPGTGYRYVVQRFEDDVISDPEITEWFNTTAMGITPTPLVGVHVVNVLPDDMNEDRLMAEISLVPDTEERSCFYDALTFLAEEGLSIGIVNATRAFKFRLRNLGYHRNNTVIISARNNGSSRSSSNVSLTFETPTCLVVHRNLTICPPDPVTGLRVVSEQKSDSNFDFSVYWDAPIYLPDNYTIQIGPLDATSEPYVAIVPGNATTFRYSLETIGLPHIIIIIAESSGGTSTPVSIPSVPHFPTSSSVSYEASVVFPAVTLMAALMTIIYIWIRYRKMRNCRDPHRYCKENFRGRTIFNLLYEKSKLVEMDNKIEDDSLIMKDHFLIGKMQLRVKDILGSGFSGVVRLGSLKIDDNQTLDVAVKMLRDCPSPEDIKNFQHEMLVMKSAGRHPNIVSLIGCCTSEIKPMIVVEYCSKGDLQAYLRNIWKNMMEESSRREAKCQLMNARNRNSDVSHLQYENNQESSVANELYDFEQEMLKTGDDTTAADLLSFALQIANGMKFLSLNRIIHRDLAARNVLICSDKTVKISDFGLSRDIYQDSVYKKQGDGKLPLKWMAVEALTHQIYTSQSDVWSFGILLWEIVTLGCNPYPDTPTHTILQVLKTGYRMERPSNCGKELYDIMLSCWRTRPRSRPTFADLKCSLEKLLQSINHHEYLNLYDIDKEPRSPDTSA